MKKRKVNNMAKAKKLKVGAQVLIPAGTQVYTQGARTKRERDSIVTIRALEQTSYGNTRIVWKSHGYRASTVLK